MICRDNTYRAPFPPPVSLMCMSRIPPERGRGSSSAVDGEDLLNELLRQIRLPGVFHSRWFVRAPWSIEGDTEATCAVLHYVSDGECWVSGRDLRTVRLSRGDVAIFPTGRAHRISDDPDRQGTALS